MERSLDDFSNFDLKRILEVHKFRRYTFINFILKGLFINLNLVFTLQNNRIMSSLRIIICKHIRFHISFWILIFVVSFIIVNSLDLFSEHFNLSLQLYIFISQLKQLTHHSTTLFFSFLSAFSGTLPVFKLSKSNTNN